jgi:hypothetical protein
MRDGRLYITVGNQGGPETREPFGPAGAAAGWLMKSKGHGVRFVADLATFEKNNNPDKGAAAQPGLAIDSNPQAVLALDDKQLVVDAAGNDLLKVDRKGRISVVAVLFTNVIDTAFDKRGRLLVLTIAAKGLLQAEAPGGDFTGLLTRVEHNGKRTVLAKEGLVAPTGLAVDKKDGAIYISNYGVFPGSGPTPPGTGQVVRLKP